MRILVLTTILLTVISVRGPSSQTGTGMPAVIQASPPTNPYVTAYQISNPKNSSDLVPYVVYPSGSTIWVSTTNVFASGQGQHSVSQILNFTSGQTHVVLSANISTIDSMVYDQMRNRLWFLENDSLAYYNVTKQIPNYTVETSFGSGSNPRYMAIDHSNRLWVTLANVDQIAMYDPSTRLTPTKYNLPTKASAPWGITVSDDNTVWFAEAAGKKIGHLTPCNQPNCITEYTPPSDSGVTNPVQLIVGHDGIVWFTDHTTNMFGRLTPSTNDWKVFPIGYCPTDCGNGLPNGISFDPQGNVWFSEHIAGRIAKYEPSTGLLIEYIVHGGAGAFTWWATAGQNNLVWFSSVALGQIGYVNASIPVTLSLSGPASITLPRASTNKFVEAIKIQQSTAVSLGLSPTSQDAPGGGVPPLVYGATDPTSVSANSNIQTLMVTISSAWNSTLGPRYVGVTASDGNVNVSRFVNVTIVEPTTPYLALGAGIFLIAAALTLLIRRPKPVRTLKTTAKKTCRGR